MDIKGLNHMLTEEERSAFDRDGYMIVPDALPLEMVPPLAEVAGRLAAEQRAENGEPLHKAVQYPDFIGKDDVFLELLDWPKTFHKVWGILGWHIQLYHSHLIVTPPIPEEERGSLKRLGWHQDSGRLNIDIEATPRPRISLKVAFFLTDTTEPNCGNFSVIPGSHLRNKIALPDDGVSEPEGATAVEVPAGTAVFFDRRLWHAGGRNTSDLTRKVLFYGYGYRWLRPRDDMTVGHYLERSDPIRRQLLGVSTGGKGYTSPTEEDIPLKSWIRDHVGEAALVP